MYRVRKSSIDTWILGQTKDKPSVNLKALVTLIKDIDEILPLLGETNEKANLSAAIDQLLKSS